ncbi:MAG: hypothetical protein HUU47_10420 [Bacteroidetes bacterium]|nr:hypothetical protein [Bacteroidota bacterium]
MKFQSIKVVKEPIRVIMNDNGFFQYNSNYWQKNIPMYFLDKKFKQTIVDLIDNPEFLMVNYKNIVSVYNNTFCIRSKEKYKLKFGKVIDGNVYIHSSIELHDWSEQNFDKIKIKKSRLDPIAIGELAVPLFFFNKTIKRLVNVQIADSIVVIYKSYRDSSYIDILKLSSDSFHFIMKDVFILSKFNLDSNSIINDYPIDLIYNFTFFSNNCIGIIKNADFVWPVGRSKQDYLYYNNLLAKNRVQEAYIYIYEIK